MLNKLITHKYQCPKCNYASKDNYHVRRHIDAMHRSVDIMCLKCNGKYSTKKEFDDHDVDCWYECSLTFCPINFKTKNREKFLKHERGHTRQLIRLV